ncbi:MAG: PEP-CTERM sorting domain-containing protein [Candidatus Auribacterota bacterium]
MKISAVSIMTALLTIASTTAFSAVTVEFGSTPNENGGSITGSVNNMTLDFGELTVTNSPSSELQNARIVVEPAAIVSKTGTLPGASMYAISPVTSTAGLKLYADVDSNGTEDLIMSGDLHIVDMITLGSGAHVSPSDSLDVTNIALHNTQLMLVHWFSIPYELITFEYVGFADLTIDLSAIPHIFSTYIDNGTDLNNIEIVGTMTTEPSSVPEPAAIALFGLGFFVIRRKIRRA